MRRAGKNVGELEVGNNGGKLYDYYRSVYYVKHGIKLPDNSSTCGVALETWYLANGIDPKISWAARAKNWKVNCPDFVSFDYTTSLRDIYNIPRASAIIYQVGKGQYHVGLFVKAAGLGFYSVEVNTTSRRSLVTYKQQREGQFVCYTPIAGYPGFKPLGYCDVIPNSATFTKIREIQNLRKKYNIK